jgi:hypothetical protein
MLLEPHVDLGQRTARESRRVIASSWIDAPHVDEPVERLATSHTNR